MEYGRRIAEIGLGIQAIKLRPEDPFVWASGYRMPIYNDNRMFLSNPNHRRIIAEGFLEVIRREQVPYDIIAGTSTAGIAPATTLADLLKAPLIYVRDKPKDHGLKNQIEGIDAESDLGRRCVVLVEDLISTGGSSVKAVSAIRQANGVINYCLSIFNYGFEEAAKLFREIDCNVHSLLTYGLLLEVAKETDYVTEEQIALLKEWRANPFEWGEKHGFPKVERGGN